MHSETSEHTEGPCYQGGHLGHLAWRSGYENKEKQTLEPLYCPSVKQSLSQRVFITYYVSVITTSTDQNTWCKVVRISSDWVRGHFQPKDRIICKNHLIIYSKKCKFFQRKETRYFPSKCKPHTAWKFRKWFQEPTGKNKRAKESDPIHVIRTSRDLDLLESVTMQTDKNLCENVISPTKLWSHVHSLKVNWIVEALTPPKSVGWQTQGRREALKHYTTVAHPFWGWDLIRGKQTA